MKEGPLKCPACGSQNPSSRERCEICGCRLDLTEEEKNILDNLSKISKVGRSRAEDIVSSGFSGVEELEEAGIDDMTSVEGIGPNIAENIIDFLEDLKDEDGKIDICDGCGSFIRGDIERCPECDQFPQKDEEDVDELDRTQEKKDRCSICGSFLVKEENVCPVCGDHERENIGYLSSSDAVEGKKSMRAEDKGSEELVSEIDPEVPTGSLKRSENDDADRFKDDMSASLEEALNKVEEKETEEIVDEIKKLEKVVARDMNGVESKERDDGESTVERERYEAYPGELEEDKARIKDVLEEIDDENIPIDRLEERFDELSRYEEEERYEKALDLAIDLLFDVESLEILMERLEEAEDMREDLSTEKTKKRLSTRLEGILDRCRDGDYEEALRLSDTLTDLYKDDQRHRLEKKFERELRRVQKSLKVARETNIRLKNIKMDLKRGRESKKSGNIKKGLSYLEKTLSRLEDIFVFSSKLEEAKGKLKDIRKAGGNTRRLSRRLKKLKDIAERGNLNQANNRMDDLLLDIKVRKERVVDGEGEKNNESKTTRDDIEESKNWDEARLESMKDRIVEANEEPLSNYEKDDEEDRERE